MQEAYAQGVLSMSHRGSQFVAMSQQIQALLREKLGIPADYTVLYTASATECWQLVSRDLGAGRACYHYYNGAFGEKWAGYAETGGSDVARQAFALAEWPILDVANEGEGALIALTQNETSNGTALDMAFVRDLRMRFPSALIALDCTSAMAGVAYHWQAGDAWFASVQKCFGLPAGLGLLVLSPRAVEVARQQFDPKRAVYNSTALLLKQMENFQTNATPNVLGLYLLSRVLEQVPPVGETDALIAARAQAYYAAIADKQTVKPLVARPETRSQTIIAVKAEPAEVERLKKQALSLGLQLGSGYGAWKADTFRSANFPAHSDGDVARMLAFLGEIE
jgi:phosphoserine aminotransferase